jgi:hypothetical protein
VDTVQRYRRSDRPDRPGGAPPWAEITAFAGVWGDGFPGVAAQPLSNAFAETVAAEPVSGNVNQWMAKTDVAS